MRGVTIVKSFRLVKKDRFQLTRLMRGVTYGFDVWYRGIRFQLTRLMRGVTFIPLPPYYTYNISTHTPHARRDYKVFWLLNICQTFQLTRLMRGVTHKSCCNIFWYAFQLTRLMRGVTVLFKLCLIRINISTHTPHARRDRKSAIMYRIYDISTHTPHARRDHNFWNPEHFNSHASCEAWPWAYVYSIKWENFNSHASCEAWQLKVLSLSSKYNFNSHASCEAWHEKYYDII